ncbi:MAG: oligosaccharide flippase family protein [Anaerolineae bacterium]|nr:oligosaccharide flippase family protein [Anaerolineae bacterium]
MRQGIAQAWEWIKQRIARHGLGVGVLLLLPLLIFGPVTLGDKTLLPIDALYTFEPYRTTAETLGVTSPQNPLLADLILQNYPWQRLIVESVKARTVPFWDPFLFSGHPFLANGQHSALYPLRLVFHLLPLARAYGVFIVFQLGLAGVWAYILGRVLGASRTGAFLGGISFELSAFLVVSAVHPMIVAGASWLPLLLALQELTLQRRPLFGRGKTTLPWALLGAIALGLQILAGHAEVTYFTLVVMAAFAAWRLLYRLFTLPREHHRVEILSPAAGLLAMVVLGLGLGAGQLVPLYEVAQTSFRQGSATLQDVLGWAYPKRRILTFLAPNFFGNPTHRTVYDLFTGNTLTATVDAYGNPIQSFDWGLKNYVEGGAYVGLLPLLLAGLAILTGGKSRSQQASRPGILANLWGLISRWFRDPYVPFFTLLSIFSLGCIFGTPLYAIVFALPFLNQSHSPFRWVFPLTVSVAALAALGATAVGEIRKTHGPDTPENGEQPASSWPRSRFGRRILRILLLDTRPNAVSIVAALAFWGGAGLLGGLWASRLAFDRIEPLVERIFWSLAGAPGAYPNARAFYAYEFHWLQQAALLLIASGAALRVSRCPIYWPKRLHRRPVWEILAILVLVVDLCLFGAGFNPEVNPTLLDTHPAVVDFLQQDTGIWRFSTFDPHGHKLFNANAGMFYDFQDVRGYDSLFPAQYVQYMEWIEPQGELLYNRIAPFTQFSSLDSPLTDLLNVKYILTDVDIPLPKYQLVYQDDAVRVYENLTVMPRAFTLAQMSTVLATDLNAVGDLIQTYDPRFYAILETSEDAWNQEPPVTLDPPAPPQPAEPQAQPVVAYELNQVVVDATIQENSWLILDDAYFPGWKAFVRPQGTTEDAETELPLGRYAGNFRAVPLQPGSWTVRFRFSPNSLKFGLFLSFLSGMMIVFSGVIWTWRRSYRERADQTAVQRLAKNSVAPILLTLFNRVLDFGFAALALRILGPANAGDQAYAIAIFGWFEILTNFGLDAYLTREVSRHPDQANRYLFNTTAIRLGLSLICIPALVGFVIVRQNLFAEPAAAQAMLTLILLYFGLLPGSINKGLTSLFYAFEKAEYPAAISTISTLLKISLQTAVLFVGWGIVGLAGASIVVNLATLAILGVLAWRLFFKPHWEPERALRREMMSESWPLMVNHLLATLFFKVDIFLLEAMKGSFVVGLYATGYKYLDALMVIPSMFTLALFPIISRKAQEDRQGFLRFYRLGVKLLVSLALPAAIIATVAGREMVLVLGGEAYLPGAQTALQLMVWSMPVGWINSLTQYVLIALDQQRYLTRAFLIGFAINFIANLILIPRFGYQASAVIHTFSELALLIPFAIGLQRQLGKLYWGRFLSKPVIAGGAMGAVILLLLPVHRGLALLAGLLVYPLVAWRLRLFTSEEQSLLAPLLRKRT